MPQVSLYVDDATMEQLRKDAQNEGTSISKHVVRRLKDGRTCYRGRCDTPSGLPSGFFAQLYGCIDDDTFVRPSQLEERAVPVPSFD